MFFCSREVEYILKIMDIAHKTNIIPEQIQGGYTGARAKAELPSRHDAILLFNEAKHRLLDINHWHKLCGKGSAIFRLTDESGNLLEHDHPERGMLIRIELPALKNSTGSNHDWVRIEAFEHQKNLLKDEEIFGFRVRPTTDPYSNQQNGIAHFFTREATSSFLIVREANIVRAMERGRNEIPNTWPQSWLNKIRNGIIAAGAMLGLSLPQWKCLVNGLLKGYKE
jgi:hypothetical protein